MQRIKLMVASTAVALMASSAALANDELLKMQENPNEWVMPTGNYANWRYSELDEITKENVGDLQVAWTFSTGVLRGHEGGPLVMGDVSSEERRVGKECVSTCSSRWASYH